MPVDLSPAETAVTLAALDCYRRVLESSLPFLGASAGRVVELLERCDTACSVLDRARAQRKLAFEGVES